MLEYYISHRYTHTHTVCVQVYDGHGMWSRTYNYANGQDWAGTFSPLLLLLLFYFVVVIVMAVSCCVWVLFLLMLKRLVIKMSEIFGSFLWIVNRNHRVECAEKGANKNGWREKERVLMALRSEHPPETKQQQKKSQMNLKTMDHHQTIKSRAKKLLQLIQLLALINSRLVCAVCIAHYTARVRVRVCVWQLTFAECSVFFFHTKIN